MCRQFLIIKITAPASAEGRTTNKCAAFFANALMSGRWAWMKEKGGGGKEGRMLQTLGKLCERRWPTAGATADNGVMTNKSA